MLLSLNATVGCDDGALDTAGSGSGGATSVASSTAASTTATNSASTGAGVPTILFSATLVPNGPGGPIDAATVCVFDSPGTPCTKSAADGTFDIALPANAETGIQISKTGRGSILIAIETSDRDASGAVLGVPTTAQLASYYGAAGTPYPDAGHGFLAVFVQPGNDFQNGQPGATVTLTPGGGGGPFYGDAQAMPDATLTMTSTSGVVRFGALAEGEQDVEATCPPGTSAQSVFFGWSGGSTSAARVPIVEGFETRVGFGCF